jgi:hypothetical protein
VHLEQATMMKKIRKGKNRKERKLTPSGQHFSSNFPREIIQTLNSHNKLSFCSLKEREVTVAAAIKRAQQS